MSNNRSILIAKILEKRQKRAEMLKRIRPLWLELKLALESIERYRHEYAEISEIAAYLQSTSFIEDIKQIQREVEEVDSLIQRFNRDTLNIGVIGQAGQGKSRLLQSITGLDDSIIPSNSKDVCTNALSRIFYRERAVEVSVEVEFYSWSSFRDEVIALYYKSLDLGPVPETRQEFRDNRPRPLSGETRLNKKAQYLYGRLCKKYWNNFEKYEFKLTGLTGEIEKKDIRLYITQDNQNENIENPNYYNLAVKEVRIFYKFDSAQDVEQVGFIDLPGLGKDNLYDLARFTNALRQDIDLLLFVRKLDSDIYRGVHESDMDLFSTAFDTLGSFPISECSYVVINRFRYENDPGRDEQAEEFCEKFKKEIQKTDGINVKDTLVVDCSNSETVRSELLDPILNYISENMDRLYESYELTHRQRLAKLQMKIQDKLNSAPVILESYGGNEGTVKFNQWFRKTFFPSLTGSLQKELDRLEVNKNANDTDFAAKINEIIEQCLQEDILPSDEDIIKAASRSDSSYKVAYYLCLLPMKLNLTNCLEGLNVEVERLLKDIRLSVSKALIDGAGLKSINELEGDEFLQDLWQRLPNSFIDLKTGFEKLINYPGSKASPVSWVQSELDRLLPDYNIDPISQRELLSKVKKKEVQDFWNNLPSGQQSQIVADALETLGNLIQLNSTEKKVLEFVTLILGHVLTTFEQAQFEQLHLSASESKAEQIRNSLDMRRQEVVNECKNILESKLKEPNMIAYSMVRQFKDQVSSENAQDYWRSFLTIHQDKVWDGATEQANYAEVVQRWGKLVDFAKEINQSNELLFPSNEQSGQ